MSPRILLAFAAGAMVASGIVFTAMRPGSHSAAATITPAAPRRAVAPARLPSPPAAPAPELSAVDLVHVESHAAPPPPVRRVSKPSPMPVTEVAKKWPSEKSEPVVIAKAQAPAQPPQAQPEPAPSESMPVQQSTVPMTPAPAPAPAPSPVAEREPHTVTLRPGTLISVRLGQRLSTRETQPGDTFFANLDQPMVIDGWVIADRGARAVGRVIDATTGGRVQGGGALGLQLTAIDTSDGQHIGIRTSTFLKRGPSWNDHDAATVGGAAALGAAIGAMAGGGKGAAIGAIAGGAAGAGGVVYTRRSGADIPAETRISFRVDQPVSITERLD